MDNSTKEQITDHLSKYVHRIGSQNKASKVLKDASNATISNILAHKWESISDEKWLTIAKQTGYTFDKVWVHVDTKGYKAITSFFNDSRENASVYGLICHPGGGKTHALNKFLTNHKNVIYVKCVQLLNRRTFYAEILRSLGKSAQSYSLYDIQNQIVDHILTLENPIIIIDEVERVSDRSVRSQIIDLYNKMEETCGIVLLGTEALKNQFIANNKNQKVDWNTLFDRIGGRTIDIPAPGKADVAAIVTANGITEETDVNFIVNGCKNDNHNYTLRRVKRLVHSLKLQEQAA